MKRFDTIIFDLGGVLIDWNPAYLYSTIFTDPKEMHWFFANITTSDWNEEQDAGRSLAEATEILVKQFPEHEQNIRAYYGRWEEMLRGPIAETVEIFRYLKFNTDYKLYALTNWSAETFPRALELYEFLHWFDGRLVSGSERMKKPSKEIYELLIKRFSIDPMKAIYTDDNLRNLKPAQELGIHTIHFQSPAQFKAELQEAGVLPV